MAIIIPLLSLFLGFTFFFSRSRELRISLLYTSITHAAFVLAASEMLSALGLFSDRAVLAAWALLTLTLLLIHHRRLISNITLFSRELRARWSALQKADIILISLIGCLFFPLLIVAVFGTPNNHDSMTYHLPRILMWFQNKSLAHFPADDFRMLYNPPLAELLQAHAWVMAAKYRPAMNLVQLGAYILLAVEASLLAGAVGATERTQLIAMICAATLPSSVLQAPTTQNDLVMGAFLFGGFAILLSGDRAPDIQSWIIGLIAIALALAAKATAFFFIPFIILIPCLRVIRFRSYAWLPLLILIILPSAGWMMRNKGFFDNALGYHDRPSMQAKVNFYRNASLNPASCTSTAARNVSLFLATPLSDANALIERAVRAFCRMLGQDPDDSNSTWYYQKYHLPVTGPHEDLPPLLWHFLLAAALVGWTLLLDISRRKLTLASKVSLLCALGLLGTAAYVKWMPWNARFMALWLIPVLAVNAKRLDFRYRGVLLAAILTLLSLPFACFAMRRSLVGFTVNFSGKRIEMASVFQPDPASKFTLNVEAAENLKDLIASVEAADPEVVTLVRCGIDPAVYPAMALLSDKLDEVRFLFRRSEDMDLGTDILLALGSDSTSLHPRGMDLIASNGYGSVWIPTEMTNRVFMDGRQQ